MNLKQSFISKASAGLLHYRFKGGKVHKFCCLCSQLSGFDKKEKKISVSGAKGYFYPEKGATNFKCHTCSTGEQFHNSLQDHFPKEFIAYVKEREQRGTKGKGHNCPTLANALESIGGEVFKKPVFRKPTKNPIQQRRGRHQHPNKIRVVAIYQKSRNCHPCAHLSNNQDARHTSTI